MAFQFVYPNTAAGETAATYSDFQALVTALSATRSKIVFYNMHRVWVIFSDGTVCATEFQGNNPPVDFPGAVQLNGPLIWETPPPF